MEGKKLGVLGGMGPMATSLFFEKVIENTAAKKDQDHIDMIILNHSTIPDRTEAILEQKENAFLKAVKKDFQILEYAGVSNIAIPCNTSHYFIKEMQEMTDVNIINMIDETVKYIHDKYGGNAKVGILATDGTINSEIYQNGCSEYNLKPVIPMGLEQEQVMNNIYNFKEDKPVNITEVETIIDNLINEEDCSCVILGCTELSCLELNEEVSLHCVDAMQALVDQSILLSGKLVKD
ncbi:aspartate racemase [Virgibacillus profundi]|uniref:Aspartate racemase n=1 Tax=Virgibacillus profundi TaxID=2024555 RepID=A0A2A2IK68_9BACI|nr:amino acid racemase [Virgibacillus profundi]PAV31513.1 aspartate racemase [Virgibacillus profundi]PXY55699.1 aspartate/glutamate racemase family protein [Virgibacillus profundi]